MLSAHLTFCRSMRLRGGLRTESWVFFLLNLFETSFCEIRFLSYFQREYLYLPLSSRDKSFSGGGMGERIKDLRENRAAVTGQILFPNGMNLDSQSRLSLALLTGQFFSQG